MDYVFDVLGWTKVIHCIDPTNVGSQSVARRLGSTNLGPTAMPPPLHEMPVEAWGQTRAEWKARRSAA